MGLGRLSSTSLVENASWHAKGIRLGADGLARSKSGDAEGALGDSERAAAGSVFEGAMAPRTDVLVPAFDRSHAADDGLGERQGLVAGITVQRWGDVWGRRARNRGAPGLPQ
jgi:hypothetical protein